MTEDGVLAHAKKHGIPVNDGALLLRALTHRSFLKQGEHENIDLYNESLEFLGDSLLGFVVSAYLFERYPQEHEGTLTKIKSSVVSKYALFIIAEDLSLFDVLRISGINIKKGVFHNILSDAVEALIGAVYLNRGFEVARQFVLEKFVPLIDRVPKGEEDILDYKSLLQDYTQRLDNTKPIYRVISTTGPDHEKEFTVSVEVAGEIYGPTVGRNKKIAGQEVAKIAYSALHSKNGR